MIFDMYPEFKQKGEAIGIFGRRDTMPQPVKALELATAQQRTLCQKRLKPSAHPIVSICILRSLLLVSYAV